MALLPLRGSKSFRQHFATTDVDMHVSEFYRSSIEPAPDAGSDGRYQIEVTRGMTSALATPGWCYTARLLFIPAAGPAERTPFDFKRVPESEDDAAQHAYDALVDVLRAYEAHLVRTGERWEILHARRELEKRQAAREGRRPPRSLPKAPPARRRISSAG